MMRLVILAIAGWLALSISSTATAQVADEPMSSSRYSTLDDCEEIASSIDPDYVLHRCDGLNGIPIWWRYSDSARLYVGFGEVPHWSGFFGVERDPDWPIEWRGSEYMMRFSPFAVIVRMRAPFAGADQNADSFLTVFKLNRDGTSCILDSNIADNARAQRVADRAPFSECEGSFRRYRGITE